MQRTGKRRTDELRADPVDPVTCRAQQLQLAVKREVARMLLQGTLALEWCPEDSDASWLARVDEEGDGQLGAGGTGGDGAGSPAGGSGDPGGGAWGPLVFS